MKRTNKIRRFAASLIIVIGVFSGYLTKLGVGGIKETLAVSPPTESQIRAKIDILGEKLFLLELIRFYSLKYGVDPNLAYAIASFESGLNPKAQNPDSTAAGSFQIVRGTWGAFCSHIGKFEVSRYDPEDGVKCGLTILATKNGIRHWQADKNTLAFLIKQGFVK